jgi:hypothetical protein
MIQSSLNIKQGFILGQGIYRKEIRLACQIPISAGNEPFRQEGQQGEFFS